MRCFFALLSFLLAVLPVSAASKPNIIIVLVDDMGWADFSCFGNTEAQTPNIDRLAKEGLRFHDFYVNAPICSPSRAAILTGQYPQRWRIESFLASRAENKKRDIANWLDPRAPSLGRILHDSGYATGHFGKWHLGGQRDVGNAPLITEYGFDQSYTSFEGLGPRVLPLGDKYDGSEPTKHALGSDKLPTGPIQWKDRSKITGVFVTTALDFISDAGAAKKPFYINLWPDDVHSPFFPPKDTRGDEKKKTLYLAVLQAMDTQLGVLFDKIRNDESLRDNTLILVFSDNGPEPGAGSAGEFRGGKGQLYEGGVRSPLIVWGPGFINGKKAGSINKTSIIAAIDLAPSLLAIADVSTPAGVSFDGIALPKTLFGFSDASRDKPLFFRRPPDRDKVNTDDNLPDLAVREGKWKFYCEFDGTAPELYDLETDPSEKTNLASDQPDKVKQLTALLLDWDKSLKF